MSDGEQLAVLQRLPLARRVWGYARLTGPGYLQSAMTLGGGSVASCVVMGSMLGYELLWVQPLAIFFGYFVLASVAKQTTHTEERPYRAFWQRLHPALAILWAVSSLVATIIWHFPQYSLTANGVVELATGLGLQLDNTTGRLGIGVVVLAAATCVVFLYSRGARGLRVYETVVKSLVWGIVVAFAVVVFASGVDWGRLFFGITGVAFIQYAMENGVSAEVAQPIIGGMAAAVGINMVFLYPYSLLNKGWGKKYKEMAYFDLISGMVIPFLLATAFMMIATANTIGPEPGEQHAGVRDIRELVPVLSGTFGESFSLILIGFGMVAIGFSTIITHMIACGFIGCEMFGVEHTGRAKWLFSMLPAIGMLGVIFTFPWYAAITASTLAFPLMPVAVVCFIILLNRKSFMGDARPRGGMALVWNGVLILAVIVMTAAAAQGMVNNWNTLREEMTETAASVLPSQGEEDFEPSVLVSEFTHRAMATEFELRVEYLDVGGPKDMEQIAAEAFAAIDDLEARMSSWQRGSETWRVNQLAAERPVKVSPMMLDLLATCQEMHRATYGAFDISVGPLSEIWGFYDDQGRSPTPDAIDEAMAKVGMGKVRVDERESTVRLAVEGMWLNFGGIGKGLALDTAAEVFERYGLTNVVMHSGSSTVLALGPPLGEDHWTVEIRNPYNARKPVDTLELTAGGFSTSGCYEKTLEMAGETYCHVIDPRTGYPARGVLSVSVFADTAALADGYSTGLLVLGETGIERFCRENPETRVVFVAEPENERPEPVRFNFEERNAA